MEIPGYAFLFKGLSLAPRPWRSQLLKEIEAAILENGLVFSLG